MFEYQCRKLSNKRTAVDGSSRIANCLAATSFCNVAVFLSQRSGDIVITGFCHHVKLASKPGSLPGALTEVLWERHKGIVSNSNPIHPSKSSNISLLSTNCPLLLLLLPWQCVSLNLDGGQPLKVHKGMVVFVSVLSSKISSSLVRKLTAIKTTFSYVYVLHCPCQEPLFIGAFVFCLCFIYLWWWKTDRWQTMSVDSEI